MGDGFTSGVAVGPVISASALENVDRLVKDAVKTGATVLTGGKKAAVGGDNAGGYFFEPTVLDGVSGGCAVAREEIFGPLVRSVTWAPLAIAQCESIHNHSNYGCADFQVTSLLQAPLQKFSTEAEVVKAANATNVGLAGYFYTKCVTHAAWPSTDCSRGRRIRHADPPHT